MRRILEERGLIQSDSNIRHHPSRKVPDAGGIRKYDRLLCDQVLARGMRSITPGWTQIAKVEVGSTSKISLNASPLALSQRARGEVTFLRERVKP